MNANQNSSVTVYGLASSEDGELRYVGQTIMPLARRLRAHLAEARKKRRNYRHHWINDVLARGYQVVIFVLHENVVLHEDEIAYIAHHRALGTRLVNLTNGGEGAPGCVRSEAARTKLSLQMRGNKFGRNNKGRKFSIEHRGKLLARLVGNTRGKGKPAWNRGGVTPLAVRERISASLRERFAGERNPNAKLTAENVKTIRVMLAQRWKQQAIAALFDVTQAEISRIAHNQRWPSILVDAAQQATINAACNYRKAGGGHPRAKLTSHDVREIRIQAAAGVRIAEIAKHYQISTVQVYRIRDGLRRADVL